MEIQKANTYNICKHVRIVRERERNIPSAAMAKTDKLLLLCLCCFGVELSLMLPKKSETEEEDRARILRTVQLFRRRPVRPQGGSGVLNEPLKLQSEEALAAATDDIFITDSAIFYHGITHTECVFLVGRKGLEVR